MRDSSKRWRESEKQKNRESQRRDMERVIERGTDRRETVARDGESQRDRGTERVSAEIWRDLERGGQNGERQ